MTGEIAAVPAERLPYGNNALLHGEITIAGHLPRPVEELSPSLKGEIMLCTDMSYLVRCGELVIAAHWQSKGSDPETWEHSLLMFPVDRIRESLEV